MCRVLIQCCLSVSPYLPACLPVEPVPDLLCRGNRPARPAGPLQPLGRHLLPDAAPAASCTRHDHHARTADTCGARRTYPCTSASVDVSASTGAGASRRQGQAQQEEEAVGG